jgi:hypothetical protein
MWLKYALENIIRVGYPPRSEWIDSVYFESEEEIIGDKDMEEYAILYPEDIDGELDLTTFNKENKKKIYIYPDQNLEVFNDIMFSGGYGFHKHKLDEAPFK